jgi:LEA14-like dessication related protein
MLRGAANAIGDPIREVLSHATTPLDPRITVQSMSVKRLHWTGGGTLNVVMEMYNPNNFPLEVRRLSYHIAKQSDGTLIADGSSSDVFPVPQRSKVEWSVLVECTYAGVVASDQSIYEHRQTVLKMKGEVTVHLELAGKDLVVPYLGEVVLVFED